MNSTEKTRIPKSPNPHVPIDDLDSFLVSMKRDKDKRLTETADEVTFLYNIVPYIFRYTVTLVLFARIINAG
jgi:hypothetical protein